MQLSLRRDVEGCEFSPCHVIEANMGPHFTHCMCMHPDVCADMHAEASAVYSTAAKAIELRVH